MTANAFGRQPPDTMFDAARIEPEPLALRPSHARDLDGLPDPGRPSGQDGPDIGGPSEEEPLTNEIETSLWFG